MILNDFGNDLKGEGRVLSGNVLSRFILSGGCPEYSLRKCPVRNILSGNVVSEECPEYSVWSYTVRGVSGSKMSGQLNR